jgi:alanine dehydrogenase
VVDRRRLVTPRPAAGAAVADTAANGERAAATLLLSDEDVQSLFSWEEAIEALRAAYARPVDDRMLPPRTMARGDGVWLRSLSAVPHEARYMGAKLIAAVTSARRASYLIALFDRRTAELVALLDGNHVTGARTAATSAVAIAELTPDRPLRVAVIGSGFEARKHVEALPFVRDVAALSVFSPTAENRERFAVDAGEHLGVPATAVRSAREAVEGADLVIAAARSRDETPTLAGAWLAPGTTVVSIGSTLPEQRELDADVVRRAASVVADMADEVAHETGDMLAAAAAGVAFDDKLVALADVVAGGAPGRRADDDIVLYKSVGSALQDVTVAEACLRRALERGVGRRVADVIVPVDK